MRPSDLETERLRLAAATLDHLHAELESPKALGHLLHARVPEGWPPGEYDRTAIEFRNLSGRVRFVAAVGE